MGGSEFIVPLTIQDISSSIILGNAPAQSVFLYARNHNLKLKQTVEIDLVLDRGLDNFIPLVTPSPITDGDTVLTAFEKIQAYFNTGIGFEIDPLFSAWIITTPPAYPGDNISIFTNDLGFITCADVSSCETDPIFSAWILATPPLYSETDPIFNAWLLTNPLASFITCLDVTGCETDPIFNAWLLATPPMYAVSVDGITITGDGVTTPLSAIGGGGATTFLALTDTPISYNTFGGYLVAVNVGESALEFIAKPVSSDYDHNALTNTHGPLPTNTSDLVNDSGFITCLDVPSCETDPIFSAWLIATPPLYSETDPLSLHLDQTSAQTFTGGAVSGSGLLKVTAGLLGLDTSTYLTSLSGALLVTGATVGATVQNQVFTNGIQSNPIYTKWVSLTADTVGDRRINDGVNEECTVGAVTKGGGTWVTINISIDDTNVVITPTYTGSLAGTSNQKEVNDVVDGMSGGGSYKAIHTQLYNYFNH